MGVKHMKRYPTSVIIREMQINPTLRFYFSPIIKPTKFSKFEESIGKKVVKVVRE